MGIGTSKGAFYRDDAHYNASQWDHRYDDNDMIISPQELQDRKDFPAPILAGYMQNEVTGGATFIENTPDVSTMRRGANDNEAGLYNPREPLMIGNDALDDFTNNLNQHFYDTVTKPHEEFIKKYDELHAHGEWMLQPGNYSEIAVAKYNKLGRALGGRQSSNKGDWEDMKYVPQEKEDRREKIGEAALRLGANGEIFKGKHHGEAFENLMNTYPDEKDFKGIEDGFLTSKGRFVTREQAMDIAKETGQLKDKEIDSSIIGLLSEDLSDR